MEKTSNKKTDKYHEGISLSKNVSKMLFSSDRKTFIMSWNQSNKQHKTFSINL